MDLMYSKNPDVFNNPELMRLGNCQFRRFRSQDDRKFENQLAPYTEHDDEMINCAELDDDMEIKVTKSGQFLTQMHVAPFFFKAIVGTKGSKKREIEADTNTRIKIPKIDETGDIVITGSSERDICSARTRINLIVLQMRDTHQVTHFVSVPLISEQIRNNFLTFKATLLDGPPMRGIEESIFQSPQKLHLTIATFVLLDDFEVDNAKRILQECKTEVLDSLFKNAGPLQIVLKGIEIMNDDPTAVDVLYGKVQLNIPKYNANFQKMADKIADHFVRKGLIRQTYDNVKLHVTLMNSRYRKMESENAGRRNKRESFDASFILDKYRHFYFGEADFSTVHLSVRFATGDDRYYECATALSVI